MIVSVEWRCLKILSPLKNNWRSSTCWQMISTRMFSFCTKCTLVKSFYLTSIDFDTFKNNTFKSVIFKQNSDWFLYEAILSKNFIFHYGRFRSPASKDWRALNPKILQFCHTLSEMLVFRVVVILPSKFELIVA